MEVCGKLLGEDCVVKCGKALHYDCVEILFVMFQLMRCSKAAS